ncbi:hypothetical protein [Vreelandella zhaodongensis]|uniref:hypothetical protein n=1 Tax=Vreelandella zhaodongensis TaxID=1176240 RepID=UPI003EBD5A93
MGLSPLKVKKLIRFDELARTLSGLELYPAPTHEEIEWHWEWEEAIRDAILDGSLEAVGVVSVYRRGGDTQEYMPPITLEDFDPQLDKLTATFKQHDIYTWLKESGNSDSDIPDELKGVASKPKHRASGSTPGIEAQDEGFTINRHTSEGIELVALVCRQFWSTYDPDDVSTAPNKDQVVSYLVEKRGTSKRMADAIDLICRPRKLQTAGLKNSRTTTRKSP